MSLLIAQGGDVGYIADQVAHSTTRLTQDLIRAAMPASPTSPASSVRQYEVRWADLREPIGQRPVLLLTRTPAYEYLEKVVVAEITTTVRGIRQEVPLGRREGLGRPSVANLDNIHAIPPERLGDLVGVLPEPQAHRGQARRRTCGQRGAFPRHSLTVRPTCGISN